MSKQDKALTLETVNQVWDALYKSKVLFEAADGIAEGHEGNLCDEHLEQVEIIREVAQSALEHALSGVELILESPVLIQPKAKKTKTAAKKAAEYFASPEYTTMRDKRTAQWQAKQKKVAA